MVTPVRADIAAAFDRLRESVARLSAILAQESAPREPAQERQDGPEPPQHAEAMADMLRELEGWKNGPTSSDDTIRKHWLMRRAAVTIRYLMAQQAGGADPLLPGLRAVEDKFRELTLRSDTNLTTDYADLVNWVSDEIARRDGTAWRGAEPVETT